MTVCVCVYVFIKFLLILWILFMIKNLLNFYWFYEYVQVVDNKSHTTSVIKMLNCYEGSFFKFKVRIIQGK